MYREPTPETTVQDIFRKTSETIPADLPPSAQINGLLKLAKMGDIQEITAQLAAIETGSPAYPTFVQTARAMVAEFDTRTLKTYLQNCLATL